MKVSLKGYIVFGKFDWENGPPRFQFFDFNPSGKDFVKVLDYTIEVDVPDDFDPRALMVRGLEREKESVTAAFQARITQINAQIQSLLAIENAAEVS
jgi:hypothetical protein